MPYLLLVMRRSGTPAPSGAEGRLAYERMLGFTERLKTRGVHLASESLTSDAKGVRLEARGGGKRILVEGPFTEANEIVGGFFLLDVPTKAEAIAIAGECPATEGGSVVEGREIGPSYQGRT